MTAIGTSAFSGCVMLKIIKIPEDAINIGRTFVLGCDELLL